MYISACTLRVSWGRLGLGTRLSLGTRCGWFYLMPSTRVVVSYCNVSCLLMQWLFVFSFATSHDRGMTPSCHGTTTPALTCEMRNSYWERVSDWTYLYLEIKYSVRKPCWPRQAFGDITNPPTHPGSVRNGKMASSEDVALAFVRKVTQRPTVRSW